MKRLVSYLIISYLIISFLGSCSHNPSNYGESPTTGNIKITVDESFKSIIDDEINVFEKIYIYAKIRPVYKPETQTYNDLLKDSVNLIVASRKLNAEENKFFESRKFFPKETKIAVDGIAIITNNDNNDSLISVNSLKKIFLGEIKSWKQLNKRSKLDAIKVVSDMS
jgi:phosphate transport system substrate-binding protein